MIISSPEITLEDGEVIVSANIKFNKQLLNKPERAWFAYPQSYLPYISGRADAFAAGFLPLAMAVKENLQIEGPLSARLAAAVSSRLQDTTSEIEGPLSARLAAGLQEYQLALNGWYPKQMSLVNIQANKLTVLPLDQAGHSCVTLFSGGVDSSYTLMTHLPDRQPLADFQVRHAIFVQGFDIPLQNRSDYENILKLFSDQLTPAGVEVIPCRTNLQYFTSGLLHWNIAHGAAMISVGLILDKLIRYFLLPSSFALDGLVPWGTSPMIDHWLSTETLQIIHHGVAFVRIEKANAISDWQPAQHCIRVCIDEGKRSGVNNCGKCDKCLRTMVALEICGSLKSFKTFPQPFGRWDIMRWVPHYDSKWLPQTLQFVRMRGKTEYVFPLWVAFLRGKLRLWVRKMIPKPLFDYLKKRKFPYSSDDFNPIYLDGTW